MIDFNVIVPNLDRRPDRWYATYGALSALGFPMDKFKRFSAHDHVEYDSLDAAKEAALKQFPHTPYLIENYVSKGYFCWSWTWYEIMTQIAEDPNDGNYTMVLVDDYRLMVTYYDILEHIQRLSALGGPLKMIQYCYNFQVPVGETDDSFMLGAKVSGTEFNRGLSHSGDIANLISPIGAREILNVANRGNRGVPNWVFWYAARELEPDGYFSTEVMAKALNRSIHISSYDDGREGYP